jgi:sigma-B regulation protein RsbU (phosphoserine phosphatase)
MSHPLPIPLTDHANSNHVSSGLQPRELETAQAVQQRLFPRALPCVPGWEFAALCRPVQAVAGDYYDFLELSPRHLAVALGDVAGKGLGPALVMAGLHAFVHCQLAQEPPNLAEWMASLNRYLLATLPHDLFVTLFLGVLDTHTGQLRYVNAGHPAPLLLPNGPARPNRLAEGGPLLGVIPGARYEEGQIILPPDSLLTLYSDGITEAANPQGRSFRDEGLTAVLGRLRSHTASQVLAGVVAEVENYAGRRGLADDLSLVVVRRQLVGSDRLTLKCNGRLDPPIMPGRAAIRGGGESP